jgi:tRNA-splicing endonuclease subunit Sen34
VSKQTQTSNAYLPLKLSQFEFYILIDLLINNENESIRILNSNLNKLNESYLNEFKQELKKYNESLKEKKRLDYLKQRREQLLSMKEKILEGKRTKLLNQLNSLSETDQHRSEIMNQLDNLESNFNLDLEQTKQINENTFEENTEIFTRTPEFYVSLFSNDLVSKDLLNLKLNESLKTCKFKCYKYFYEKGFYLTCGAKFGGDFLAYPGDPAKYHAQFIITAFDEDKNAINLKHLITFGRMATSVKKTYVLVYELNNKLNFISLNWSHF